MEAEEKKRKAKVSFNYNETTMEWYWTLTAPNGKVIADNGGHDSLAMCRAGFYATRDYLGQEMFVDASI